MEVLEVNLELKLPTVEQAKIRLAQGIREAKSQKRQVLKLIHGYGSKGIGGAIKKTLPEYLAVLKEKGDIADFVAGEDFSPFNEVARGILAKFPSLYKDKDYAKDNRGITIVVVY